MKNKLIIVTVILLSLLDLNFAWAETPHPDQYHSTYLNDFMQKFGSWAIEIQIVKFKKQKPDWIKIKADLERLERELQTISHAQKDVMYVKLHGKLEAILNQLKLHTQSKNPNIETFNQTIDQSCLQCHKPQYKIESL